MRYYNISLKNLTKNKNLRVILLNLPKIDLKELEIQKEKNRRERLAFVKLYAEWVKKHNNDKWSKAQKELIDW